MNEELEQVVHVWNIGHLCPSSIILVKSKSRIALNAQFVLDLQVLLHAHVESNEVNRNILLFDDFGKLYQFWYHVLAMLALRMISYYQTSMSIHMWRRLDLLSCLAPLQFQNAIGRREQVGYIIAKLLLLVHELGCTALKHR